MNDAIPAVRQPTDADVPGRGCVSCVMYGFSVVHRDGSTEGKCFLPDGPVRWVRCDQICDAWVLEEA